MLGIFNEKKNEIVRKNKVYVGHLLNNIDTSLTEMESKRDEEGQKIYSKNSNIMSIYRQCKQLLQSIKEVNFQDNRLIKTIEETAKKEYLKGDVVVQSVLSDIFDGYQPGLAHTFAATNLR